MASTSTSPLIRPMAEADLPRVLDIERLSFPIPWSADAFRFELASSGDRSHLLVADANGEVQGYIVYWVVADSGEILDLAVAPRARRQGLASNLVREAVTDMERRGAASVHLELRPSNTRAYELYRKYGFEKSYVRPRYFEHPPEDAWVMRLDFRG